MYYAAYSDFKRVLVFIRFKFNENRHAAFQFASYNLTLAVLVARINAMGNAMVL